MGVGVGVEIKEETGRTCLVPSRLGERTGRVKGVSHSF